MRTVLTVAAALALFSFAASGAAHASSAGILDMSRAGCGCHDYGPTTLPASPTTVKLLVDGTPAESFGGFVPGQDYELTVWVVGPVVPFVGFNLEASAGQLAAKDSSVWTIAHTECQYMQRVTFLPQCEATNPAPGKECRIERNDACPVFDLENPACKRCGPGHPSFGNDTVCRACDGVQVVDIQATHTAPNPLPFFTMSWSAPNDGTTEVTFTLAGNSVERAVGATSLDFWNFADPNPIVLRAAP